MSNLFKNLIFGFNSTDDYYSIDLTYNNIYYINFAINKDIENPEESHSNIKKTNTLETKKIKIKKNKNNNKKLK